MKHNFTERISPEWQKRIGQIKELFLAGEQTDMAEIPAVIARSWARSRQFGITPDSSEQPYVKEKELQFLRTRHKDLIECAREVFVRMFSDVSSLAFSMSLATPDGVTLAAFTPENAENAFPVATPGMASSESQVGGNAIGTCIAEGQPVEIIGAEHYRHIYAQWSCAAAPVVDENGMMIAVFNVGQRVLHFHEHTFGMVKAAAYAISEQMRLMDLVRRQQSMLELLDDGIVILNRAGQIRMLNNNAASMLDAGQVANIHDLFADGSVIERMLASGKAIHDQEAVFALKNGAKSFVYSLLPIAGGGDAILQLREPQRMRKLAVRMTGNKATYRFSDILGESEKIRRAIEEANLVAGSNTTVLLLGESGTGKELFAQAIHNASKRQKGPFIAVNCGAIPRSLLESELFGYEPGAFTGAQKNGKPGKFELAGGGTIFLDEIGEMPLDSQVALLQLLQNGGFTRVGGTERQWADVRVIAATNRDIEGMVGQGTFRQDLFYRLSTYPISIPPLRERKGDVILLAHKFLASAARALQKNLEGFSNDALYALDNYNWPGNVRELENAVERMVNITQSGWLNASGLPEKILISLRMRVSSDEPVNAPLLQAVVDREEKALIEKILLECGGNMRRAAAALGLSRPYLYRKISKLGLNLDAVRRQAKKPHNG